MLCLRVLKTIYKERRGNADNRDEIITLDKNIECISNVNALISDNKYKDFRYSKSINGFETKNIFNPISVSDYKAFALEQKDKALSEAKEKGLMKTAQENTKKSIKEIVSIIPDTDDYTIEVTFKE